MEHPEMPLATIIGRTHKFITDEFEQRINASGIDVSMVEFVLLYRLSTMNDDKITQQNFANLEGKHKSVILRQINKLEQKKWVVRTGDFTDLRKNMIIITKAGLSVLRQVLAIEAEMMIELTAGLSDEEITTFKKVALALQAGTRSHK